MGWIVVIAVAALAYYKRDWLKAKWAEFKAKSDADAE